ncbi:MAG: hypothetical protein MUC77_15380 [Chromatiaceae bacterium]|jgi:hypothetical protein|nr:hypothetical protein [Chromatiaceae bacterium]
MAQAVTLAWNPSASPNVGGYLLYYGLGRGQYTTVVDVGNQTRYTVLDLEDGVIYYFAVTAYDTTRTIESDFSNEVDTGLVAAFGFEEVSGALALDASGRGNLGSISGALRIDGGRFGGGLWFDGVDDRVILNPATSLDLTTEMTVGAWLYPTNLIAGRQAIIAKERPAEPEQPAYYLAAHAGYNGPSSAIEGADGQRLEVFGGRPLEPFQWNHLAATFDGEMLRLYLNGVEVAAQPHSATILKTGGPLTLGGLTAAGQHFEGIMDDVRVYRRAITAEELWEDMNTPVSTEVFNGLEYIASYADLIDAFRTNPTHEVGALHYTGSGRIEGRAIGAFDIVQYLANYPDLVAAFGTDFEAATLHYIKQGFFEGRTDELLFDAAQYLANYPDLVAAFGTDLEAAMLHYIQQGFFEGRTAQPLGGN